MDPDNILALLSDLYGQVAALQKENGMLRGLLDSRPDPE